MSPGERAGRSARRPTRRLGAVLALAASTAGATPPEAAPDASVAVVARAVPGPPIVLTPRPPTAPEARACSFRAPVCVQGSARSAPDRVLATLEAAERAWEGAAWALRLPSPDLGATGAFDFYLGDRVPGGAQAELEDRDPTTSFDRGSSFVLVDAALAAVGGCALRTLVARETLRAVLWRTAPATDPVTARAETSYLARLISPCALEEPAGIDVFQGHPETSLAGSLTASPEPGPGAAVDAEYAEGAALFYWWLDYVFGNAPGDIVRALWSLAPTRAVPGADRWEGSPDAFDVLRVTFKGALTSGSTLDDLLLEFAVARAFVGSAADAEHMPETRALGPAGAPRVEWSIDWPKEPRRLASGRGVEPTGAAYVEVDCAAAPKGARLRFEAAWEQHARMRWAAVKVDARGHELGALAISAPDRGTEAQGTVVDLEGVARVLFVGASTGDPSYAFDPDDPSPEPHGWVVGVSEERR